MENVGILCGNLVYFTAIRYILRPFGIYYGHLVYLRPFGNVVVIRNIFPRFGTFVSRKSGDPARGPAEREQLQNNFVVDKSSRRSGGGRRKKQIGSSGRSTEISNES
jgi:hypothetical protein